VTSRGLLIFISVHARLEGCRPQEAGEVEDLGIAFLRILWLGVDG
jgi:hypothetical protein